MASNPRQSNGNARSKLRQRVLASEDVCHLCGQPVDKTLPHLNPWSAVIDEIVPVSQGGSPFDRANVHLAHRRCNSIRSNRSVAWAQAVLAGRLPKDERWEPFPVSDGW